MWHRHGMVDHEVIDVVWTVGDSPVLFSTYGRPHVDGHLGASWKHRQHSPSPWIPMMIVGFLCLRTTDFVLVLCATASRMTKMRIELACFCSNELADHSDRSSSIHFCSIVDHLGDQICDRCFRTHPVDPIWFDCNSTSMCLDRWSGDRQLCPNLHIDRLSCPQQFDGTVYQAPTIVEHHPWNRAADHVVGKGFDQLLCDHWNYQELTAVEVCRCHLKL